MLKKIKLLLAATCVLWMAGCASSSNKVTVQESTKISKGQELNDLLRARNERAVTDAEYEALRQIILRRPQ